MGLRVVSWGRTALRMSRKVQINKTVIFGSRSKSKRIFDSIILLRFQSQVIPATLIYV